MFPRVKVNRSNISNACDNRQVIAMHFPAITNQCPRVWWSWNSSSLLSTLGLSPLVADCKGTSVFVLGRRSCGRARFRAVRVSFRDSPMEGINGAEQLEAREPAHKKQACETPHVNGCSNGSNGMGVAKNVAHSLALRVKKLAPEAILPSRGSALAAGYDLSSAYDATVPARGKALIKTELSVAIPEGTYARVAPRSGLAWKHSIDVGAGVIDADYRGPLGVILFNHSDADFSIKSGDRIAQLILERIVTPEVVEVDNLDATDRGEGGFGSTGTGVVPVVVAPVVVVEGPASVS